MEGQACVIRARVEEENTISVADRIRRMQVIQGMRKWKAKAPAPIPTSAPSASASVSASSSSAPLDIPVASQDLGNDPTAVMGGIDPPPNPPIPSLPTDDSTASRDIEAGPSSTVTTPATSNASKGSPETLQGEDIESGSDGDNEVDEVDFYGDDEIDEFESDEGVDEVDLYGDDEGDVFESDEGVEFYGDDEVESDEGVRVDEVDFYGDDEVDGSDEGVEVESHFGIPPQSC